VAGCFCRVGLGVFLERFGWASGGWKNEKRFQKKFKADEKSPPSPQIPNFPVLEI